MKKFLLAAVAVATLTGAAGAASAQAYGAPHRPDAGYDAGRGYNEGRGGDRGGYDDRRGGYGANGIDARQVQIAQRIARGERNGALDRREARGLRIELAQVADLEQRFRMSRGLDRREIAILSNRLDRLDGIVIAQLREDRGGYGGGYGGQYGNGYGDRDGRDGRGRGY
jgi:opacity protein-like surface antigen